MEHSNFCATPPPVGDELLQPLDQNEADTTIILDPAYIPSSQPSSSTTTENILDGLKFTDLLPDNSNNYEREKLEEEVKKYKWFYLKNKDVFSISLDKKSFYLSKRSDKGFIGSKFKEMIDITNKVQLLTQIVNERMEMKSIGKFLFYRELYISVRENKSVKKLFNNYINENETYFLKNEKSCIEFNQWKFLVHKNRLVYCCELLIHEFNINKKKLACIRNYEDILNYLMNV